MTIDEFAICMRAQGQKLVHLDGTWWLEPRPFFFRPLFPFTEIVPQSQRYPFKASIGGLLHVVPAGSAANSTMNFFVYDNVESYSLSSLRAKTRRSIKTGMRFFTVKPIADKLEFVEEGHRVYLSFQTRTKYSYKSERVKKNVFAQWGELLFSNPKIRKWGAYHDGKLCAVQISYLVEDVVIGDSYFADDQSLDLKVTELLLHTLRESAVGTKARYIFMGFPSGVSSLDESKERRGCKLLTLPAYYKMNPACLSPIKMFMKPSYAKLMKITAPPAQLAPLNGRDMTATEPSPVEISAMAGFLSPGDVEQKSTALAVHEAQESVTSEMPQA